MHKLGLKPYNSVFCLRGCIKSKEYATKTQKHEISQKNIPLKYNSLWILVPSCFSGNF